MPNKLFYINRNYKLLPFIALCALAAAALVFLLADTTLTSFTSRNIGEAAMRGVDINKRMYFVYLSFVAFVAVLILMGVFYRNRVSYFSEAHKDVLFYSSLFLAGSIFVKLFSTDWELFYRNSLNLPAILYLFPELLSVIALQVWIHLEAFVLKQTTSPASLYLQRFLPALSLALWIIQLSGVVQTANVTIIGSLLFVIPLLSLFLFHQKNISPAILQPIALLPLVSVVAVELYLILNAHGVYLYSSRSLFWVFSFIVIAYIVSLLFKKQYQRYSDKKFYLVYLISWITIATYTPLVEHSSEMFENANAALGLQQFFSYGKLPLIHTFNSHLLSEYFYAFIYSFINGFDVANGLAFEAYNFLHAVVVAILVYLTLQRMMGEIKAFIASVFVSILFIQLPIDYVLVLLIPLLFLYSRKHQPRKGALWMAITVVFMFLWAIDIGIAAFIATWVMLVFFVPTRKERRIYFKYILFSIASLLVVGMIVCRLNGVEFVHILSQIYYHYDAAQAYGYKALAQYYDGMFFMHYVAFPLSIIMIVGIAWKRSRRRKKLTDAMLAQYLILVFLSVFYLINFHRGLVRHALVEHTDLTVSSFVFFIIPLAAYIFTNRVITDRQRWVLFLVTGFVLVFMFKYPFSDFANQRTYFDRTIQMSISSQAVSSAQQKTARSIVPESFAREQYLELKKYLDRNVAPQQTFLDFSNTPMLYFYTDRRTPSYFNQFPNMLHNDQLQKAFISQIKNEPPPVCVFSTVPATWYDHPDEIPNAFRHYLIAEYIFSHYHPADTLNGKSIWLYNNGIVVNDSIRPRVIEHYDLMQLPYVWAAYGERSDETVKEVLSVSNTNELLFNKQNFGNNAYYVDVELVNETELKQDVLLTFGKGDDIYGSFSFTTTDRAEAQIYRLRISTQYNWYRGDINKVSVSVPAGTEVQRIQLLKSIR